MTEKKQLDRIQKEIGLWARKQFGNNRSQDEESPTYDSPLGSLAPLLGVVEEVGELCHVTIYRHQGRGGITPGQADELRKDAVADILVFLCDYANREGFSLLDVLNETWEKVCKRRKETWNEDKEEHPTVGATTVEPEKEEEEEGDRDLEEAYSDPCSKKIRLSKTKLGQVVRYLGWNYIKTDLGFLALNGSNKLLTLPGFVDPLVEVVEESRG